MGDQPAEQDRAEDEGRRREPESDDVEQSGLIHVQLRLLARCACGPSAVGRVDSRSSRSRRRPPRRSVSAVRTPRASGPSQAASTRIAQPVADERVPAEQERDRCGSAAASVSSASHGVATRDASPKSDAKRSSSRRPVRGSGRRAATRRHEHARVEDHRVAERGELARPGRPRRAARSSRRAGSSGARASRRTSACPRSSMKQRTRQALSVSR